MNDDDNNKNTNDPIYKLVFDWECDSLYYPHNFDSFLIQYERNCLVMLRWEGS